MHFKSRYSLSSSVYIPLQQEKMKGQRGILPVMALRYVMVTKVIYRLARKRKCVFRDVRIKTKVSAGIAESAWV